MTQDIAQYRAVGARPLAPSPAPTALGSACRDPRASTGFEGAGKYRINGFDEPAGTVIARSDTGQGA